MNSNKLKTGILAAVVMFAGAGSAQAYDGTYLLVQGLIAINAIDSVSLNKKLRDTNTLLTQQIEATDSFWKLARDKRTMEKEAELRSRLKEIVAEASKKVADEKTATLNDGNYLEKTLALPKIAEMEAELKQINTWISQRAYFSAQKKAIALRKDVQATQANLQ